MKTVFFCPEPPKDKLRFLPVFLPFSGCPGGRCIFCNQPAQIGMEKVSLKRSFADFEAMLALQTAPCGVGFFGGTFTGIAYEWQEKFLALTAHYRQKGIVCHVRLSTRPDRFSPAIAKFLREQGVDLVEFGIQSFSDSVLHASGRGYTGECGVLACKFAKEAGLDFGVQLLPGLPKYDRRIWFEDVLQTIELCPKTVRIYPCLVLKDTELERLFIQGDFVPWSLETAAELTGLGLLQFWRAKIQVIRLGVLGDMQTSFVAGPWHDAFGTMARSQALLQLLREKRNDKKRLFSLQIPKKYSGEIFGVRGANKKKMAELGIFRDRIVWTDGNEFVLEEE